jgi:hypothetical protein
MATRQQPLGSARKREIRRYQRHLAEARARGSIIEVRRCKAALVEVRAGGEDWYARAVEARATA